MEMSNFVMIRSYSDPLLAGIVVNALKSNGIEVFVSDKNGKILPHEEVEILVHENDLEQAEEIIFMEESL